MIQLNKTKARKYYNDGKTIVLLPSNYNIDECTVCCYGTFVTKNELNFGDSFDKIVKAFEYYRCINSQTGRYTHYFLY